METFIGIIGTLIALAGLYYTIKQITRTRIVMSDIELYNLEKENYDRFQDLKITLKEAEITNKLTFVKSLVYVVGVNDIPAEAIQQGIVIKGSENTRFHDFKIRRSNHSYQIENHENEVAITTTILKVNDYIVFEAVCENLDSKLKVEHRILNTGDTIRIDYSQLKDSRQSSIIYLILFIAFLAITFWPSSSFPSKYDFKTLYFVHGIETPLETLDSNKKKFSEGWDAALDKVKTDIDSLVKDSLLPDDPRVGRLSICLDKNRNYSWNIDLPSYAIKNKSDKLLDSIVNNNNTIQLFWSRDYRKKFELDEAIQVSFILERYGMIVINVILILVSLIFIIPGVISIFRYFKYEVPIKKLLNDENT